MRKAKAQGNKEEFLDRKKQRFELSMSASINDDDFEENADDDENPVFN